MTSDSHNLTALLFSEIIVVEQLSRSSASKVLPKGMELSHFVVLNRLAQPKAERTPAQLARMFHLTRGAMTNTLRKLERAGWVHIRPDWDDARSKLVSISPAGVSAHDNAMKALEPLIADLAKAVGDDKIRTVLPVLRALRMQLGVED